MDNKDSPILETSIESLWNQALQTLRDFSGQTWSDTDEHDPGITLLEVVTAKAAELAKRQTRPLNDLLIPSPKTRTEQEKMAVFPAQFGPQNVLTCSPVTLDDYRRVLLDLHSQEDCFNGEFEKNFFFFFSDVYIEKEMESNRYKYYYDYQEYLFTFRNTGNNLTECVLEGNYVLYLVPSEKLQQNKKLLEQAKKKLLEYLPTIENIGEKFSDIHWLSNEPKELALKIEVADYISPIDLNRVAKIYAEIYQVIKDFACPPVERYSTRDLRMQGLTNEEIYRGPFLKHGWIPELISTKDYKLPYKAYLSHLLTDIRAIKGVKKIIMLTPPGLVLNVSAFKYLSFGTSVDAILKNVSLLTKGKVSLEQELARIKQYISTPQLINNNEESAVRGQYLNDVGYAPVTEVIPACYNLSVPVPSDSTKHLHQFLLPIEQVLANENARLSNLHGMLGFDQTGRKRGDTDFWGNKWPFADSNKVHKNYKNALEVFSCARNKDYAQTVASLQYLMGYFNEAKGPNVFSKSEEDYITSLRNQLVNLPDNQYHRAAYKNIAERIAGKIGIDSSDINIVETRRALPLTPGDDSFGEHVIGTVDEVDGRLKLLLTAVNTDFKAGMLLKLEYEVSVEGTFLPIDLLMIDEVSGSDIFIVIVDTSLVVHKTDIINSRVVKVSASTTFLADVPFRLIKEGTDQGDVGDGQYKVTCTDFPALAEIGDEIIFSAKSGKRSREPLMCEIADIDRFQHTLTLSDSDITANDIKESQYWYLKQADRTERFSFMVSIVLNKQVLNEGDKDKWKEVEDWIKEILYSDLPSHCQALIHWLEVDTFRRLTPKLKDWMEDGSPIGTTSYEILETLTLGRKPLPLDGIGYSLIVTQEQAEIIDNEPDEDVKQGYINGHDIFQVNRELQ